MPKKILHIYLPNKDPMGAIALAEEHREVEKCPPLKELQEMVGGLIELIRVEFHGKEVDMIINEEGKIFGLPVNEVATRLFHDTYGPCDVVVGPALVFEGFKLP